MVVKLCWTRLVRFAEMKHDESPTARSHKSQNTESVRGDGEPSHGSGLWVQPDLWCVPRCEDALITASQMKIKIVMKVSQSVLFKKWAKQAKLTVQ